MGPLVDGQLFYWSMPTESGNVEMLAEIHINGTEVTFGDIAVYGDSPELARGTLGPRAVLSELRGNIAPALADQGYTSLRITGTRLSGPVGHKIDMNIDLTKYGTGGVC